MREPRHSSNSSSTRDCSNCNRTHRTSSHCSSYRQSGQRASEAQTKPLLKLSSKFNIPPICFLLEREAGEIPRSPLRSFFVRESHAKVPTRVRHGTVQSAKERTARRARARDTAKADKVCLSGIKPATVTIVCTIRSGYCCWH